MSALQATQADGFYYPPGWDPSKGSLDKFAGSHGALGSRARKAHLGILVVRIELPYNGWCTHCGVHVGRGKRFNAEKRKNGMYHSTPILEFAFKCASCGGKLVFATDPAGRGYAAVEGLKWAGTHDTVREEEGDVGLLDHDAKLALASDRLVALEHATRDQREAAARGEALETLLRVGQRASSDYASNSALRAKMRPRRRAAKALAAEAATRGFNMPLLAVNAADAAAAEAAFRPRFEPSRRSGRALLRASAAEAAAAPPQAPSSRKTRATVRLALAPATGGRKRGRALPAVPSSSSKRPAAAGLVDYDSDGPPVTAAGSGMPPAGAGRAGGESPGSP